MAKYFLGAAATTFAATAIFATSAFAIEDLATCQSEGGSSFDLSGTNVCLVPVRDKEWSDPIYDGNQLGITECSGRTINNGTWCLEPFGDAILPKPVVSTPPPPPATPVAVTETLLDSVTGTVTDAVTDAAIDAGTGLVEDTAKSAVKGSGL